MINPLSNPSYLLPPLVVAFIAIVLVALLWPKSRRDPRSRLFSGVLLSLLLSSLLIFAMRSSPDSYRALLWEKAVIPAGLAQFMLYYHFTLAYANIARRRWIIAVLYSFLAAFFVLSCTTELVIKGMRLEDYGYAPVVGPIGFLGFMSVPLLIIGGALNLLKRYNASSSYEERNRLIYLLVAALMPVIGIGLDAFSNLPPLAIWSNLTFCMICAAAILKYHLLDIRVAVRKGLVYVIISAVVALPYVTVLFLVSQLLGARIEPWWVHAVTILVLAIALRPLYSWGQQLVDRLFYRNRYDYLRALEQLSREFQSVEKLEQLGSTMVKLISVALRTSTVSLLLASHDDGGLALVSYVGLDDSPSGIVVRDESVLTRYLKRHGHILSSKELSIFPELQSLARKERQKLEQLEAELFVPIKSRQDELIGALILGRKLSEQEYSGEERRLLAALASQVAMTLENARLYQETRQSERALRESEKQYKELAESITDVFFATDKELRYTYLNKASEELLGISARDALGKHLDELFPNTEETRGAKEMYLEVLRTKQPRHFVNQYPLKGKDFVFEISAYPTENGIAVFARDVTERKEAEARETQLREELNRSSRLASIGELAAGVAHEINNPLTAILVFSQRLLRKSTDEKVSTNLQIIYNEAGRAARVVENLSTFARRREPKREYLNVHDILQKAIELRAYELRTSNIEVVTDFVLGLPQIMVDFHQIEQVFLNVIMNAEQAMVEAAHGGKLSITTQEVKDNVRISFTDDGPGISDKHLAKVFDPFFTTRGGSGGTGLGLSVCHGIVTEHGGRIWAKSKPRKGATFFVELPATNEKVEEAQS